MANQEIRDMLKRWIKDAQLSLGEVHTEGNQDKWSIEVLNQGCENTLDILEWELPSDDDYEEYDHILLSAFVAGIAFNMHRKLKSDSALYTDLLFAIRRHQERG